MRIGVRARGCLALLALTACGADEPRDVAAPTAASTDFDPSSLPACAEQPSPPDLEDVPGLTLPDEALVFSVYDVGALTQAEGVVEMTPVQVRRYYEQRDDLEMITVEDERVEAEILVSDGTHRMFVKAQIACATASNFTATVGSESDAAAMPTPAGSPTPPG